MPTDQEQLQTIKSQTLSLISEITAAPKPSYAIDGQAVSWSEYLGQLKQTVAWCDEQLTRVEPFENQSRGCS
jgi:hypothetical protein